MKQTQATLIGPFSQILTMDGIPLHGPLSDSDLPVLTDAGVIIENGRIASVGKFSELAQTAKKNQISIEEITSPQVLLPGFIDTHTHICFAGHRARDYALRVSGTSYLDIAKQGGGIWDTVQKTRLASKEDLLSSLCQRATIVFHQGVTTCEVKSGYGLSVEAELKMLHAISEANSKLALDLIPTCLAAHICPKEFRSAQDYLNEIQNTLLPQVKALQLAKRVDIFVDEGAFTVEQARSYLQNAKAQGFDITIHADQFQTGGCQLASEVEAVSVDHLEASSPADLKILKKSGCAAVALPGASLGLGMRFAPARQILNEGLCLAIASDWNPGSAPMGDLLRQASILGAFEKLSLAETFAAITVRAAHALRLSDRGILKKGQLADLLAFATDDYREILYWQGGLKPVKIWKRGQSHIPH